MNKNSISKVLILIAFVVFSFAIYASIQRAEATKALKEANKNKVIAYEKLAQTKDSLELVNDELQVLRRQITLYNDSLSSVLEQLSSQSNVSSKTKSLVTRADNSKYLITLHSLNPKPEVKKDMITSLHQLGYSVVAGVDLSRRTDWISQTPTVLYYSSKSESKAIEIAEILSESSGITFSIKRGAGLGVRKGGEEITFFIHYVN